MINLLIILWVIVITLLGAFGSLFLKKASKDFNFNIIKQLRNKNLILGLVLFVLGTAFYIVVLRTGSLSVIYPLTSLSYIWIAFISMRFLGEKMNKRKWIGIALIMLGIFLITSVA